jgi:ABC-2 type transport system ATP-binding protein
MAVLRTRNLTVQYGARRALSALDVEVAEGVCGLLGPNGAGKSTLLKTLLGFLVPAQGSAEVLGVPVRGRPHALRLRLGYFPERSVFVPGLSAVETVALAGELGGLSRTDALARAHDMLWFSGLGDARYRAVEEFSTGMRQRTKLAMSLVHDPELLLLDEPTSGLDPIGRRQMLELVRDVRKRGVSVMLSTHLLHDVEQVCDHVVVLDKGKLVLEGRLDKLRQHPGHARCVYEIRIREDTPGAFRKALSSHDVAIEEDTRGQLKITLPASDASRAPSTKFLFEAARSAGAEIRHLQRFEPDLPDLEARFLAAVDSAASDGS